MKRKKKKERKEGEVSGKSSDSVTNRQRKSQPGDCNEEESVDAKEKRLGRFSKETT